jgi:hypothetical protein
MRSISALQRILVLAAACALLAAAPLSHARSQKDPDKYAHKIEKKLSHFKPGTLLHLSFANNSESIGTLHSLDDHSFTFTNSETNADETHNYGDVDLIEKGSNKIGKGSESRHHKLGL